MSSTLSSQPAKRSRCKMETLQRVKIMLNRQFTPTLHCSRDMYVFFTRNTFCGSPIFLNYPLHRLRCEYWGSFRSARYCADLYLTASCYSSGRPEFHFQSVCYSSCTLSQALTMPPRSWPLVILFKAPPTPSHTPLKTFSPLSNFSATSSPQ